MAQALDVENRVQAGTDRRSILSRAGVGLMAFTTTMLITQRAARADHLPPPDGCYGYNRCHCCSTTCGPVRPELGCPTGTGCWTYVDESACRTYRCCDYLENGRPCLCRTVAFPGC
jgi:hypothetical protein